jgi:hypothetical protein
MLDTNPTNPRFTAIIRWRGPDPTIELETRHDGFPSPEEAALFANVIPPETPLALRLAAGPTVELLQPDGRYVSFPATDASVCRLPPGAFRTDELVVANDNDFEPHALSEFLFPPSALGDYDQAQYAVLDQAGRPLDVVVEWDEAEHLKVTVVDASVWDDSDTTIFLGALPEA